MNWGPGLKGPCPYQPHRQRCDFCERHRFTVVPLVNWGPGLKGPYQPHRRRRDFCEHVTGSLLLPPVNWGPGLKGPRPYQPHRRRHVVSVMFERHTPGGESQPAPWLPVRTTDEGGGFSEEDGRRRDHSLQTAAQFPVWRSEGGGKQQ